MTDVLLQGEDAMSPRRGGDTIPVSELSNFMRAIGYYPTELEVCVIDKLSVG